MESIHDCIQNIITTKKCWYVTEMCSSPFLIWREHKLSHSNTNAVGPREVGHVGRQSRVGGQDFDRQIPAEGIHVYVVHPGPNCDLRLVLQNCGRFHRLPGSDEFKVQAPPQGRCSDRERKFAVQPVCDKFTIDYGVWNICFWQAISKGNDMGLLQLALLYKEPRKETLKMRRFLHSLFCNTRHFYP